MTLNIALSTTYIPNVFVIFILNMLSLIVTVTKKILYKTFHLLNSFKPSKQKPKRKKKGRIREK